MNERAHPPDTPADDRHATGAGQPHVVPYTRAHGAGNEYLIVDGVRDESARTLLHRPDLPELARRVCGHAHMTTTDRPADGLFFIARSANPAELTARVMNADGSWGDMCGNGLRCAARLAVERGYHDDAATAAGRPLVSFRVGDRLVRAEVLDTGSVAIEMGRPLVDVASLPLRFERVDSARPLERNVYPGAAVLTIAGHTGVLIGVGNPHFVVFTDIDPIDAAGLNSGGPGGAGFGPTLEHHPAFPARVNVHAARVCSRTLIEARNHERGAGATLACGTGACAVAVAGVLLGLNDRDVDIRMPGGLLGVRWRDADDQLVLTGPTEVVGEGHLRLD